MAFAALLGVSACNSTSRPASGTGPYESAAEGSRETQRAEALTREAADLLYSDPERAEVLLRDALTADLYFGPAHNNLGVLFLREGKLYEAAHEFEWARKLLPGHPDPRFNLAMTLELSGQSGEAIEAYTSALEVYPGHVPAMQGLARLVILDGREDKRLPTWLGKIALEGESEAWREWARGQLARR